MIFDWHLHFGWEWTSEQQLWLDSGFAPAGPINWLTYVRPSVIVRVSWK